MFVLADLFLFICVCLLQIKKRMNILCCSTVMSKIWSNFIVSQWKCISWFVHDQSSLSLDVTRNYVDSAEQTIDIASSDGLLLCFDVLALLLPKVNVNYLVIL